MINRDYYLNKIISKRWNGMVKIITGIRRCGKSVLLFDLYRQYLLDNGVRSENIIVIKLDERMNMQYRNPNVLCDYIRDIVKDSNDKFYIMIDEVQLIEKKKVQGIDAEVGLYEVLNELNGYKNADVYVTGSNSKMLSSDIATEFRGRGDEIRVHPLSFKEFYDNYSGDKHNAWKEYVLYGGMPQVANIEKYEEKSKYLKDLLNKVYISDVIERNRLRSDAYVLGEVLDVMASSVGSLTSPTKLANTFKSVTNQSVSVTALFNYLDCFVDSFLIKRANRYDIKGREYIGSPAKYYFEDIGLRNARLDFKEPEDPHVMESVIYNELVIRGFDVDVGVIEYFVKNKEGKNERANLEIDFVCNKGNERYYIQSAYAIPNKEKREQEIRGFNKIDDSYQKIVVVKDNIISQKDENGILYVGIEEFLLNDTIVKY